MKTFEITIKQNGMQDIVKIDSTSIIGALENLHKSLQVKQLIDKDGYKILKACQVYPSSVGSSEMIRSEYPIPGGPNPDIWALSGREKPADAPLTYSKK